VKGRPWTVEVEKKLRRLVEAGVSVREISGEFKKSMGAVKRKIERLRLEVVVPDPAGLRTTTSEEITLPKVLFSVEEALAMLAGALKRSCEAGLEKVEVQRLQVVATLARNYKEILADYLDYRGVEQELLELRHKYAELSKKIKNDAAS
jgi:hypothetical protein